MAAYLEKEKEQLCLFSIASIKVILRSKNSNADALAKRASTRDVDLLMQSMWSTWLNPASTRNRE